MSQIKKISTMTVFGKIKLSELIAAEKQTLDVMQVIGVSVGTQVGDHPIYGPWECLQGTFRATNPSTGEQFESATCFLPTLAMTPVKVALAMPGARGVEIALMVSAKYVAEQEGRKAGGAPYEYTFRPLMALDAADDPLAKIEAKIKAQMLAIAAPPAPGNDSVKTNGAPTPPKK